MARSIETIYSLIIAEKEAKAELAGLTSESAAAVWRLWVWVTAAVLFTTESMFELFKQEIESIVLTRKSGTLLWYQAICKGFQYGDGLVWSDLQYGYPIYDSTKQLISQCSVRDGVDGLVVKIAKEVGGVLTPLTSAEEGAFQAYIQKVKFAGTRLFIINSSANLLRCQITVYYDPMILTSGGLSLKDGSTPVEAAINNYLLQLPFDGRLQISMLSAALMRTEGIKDIYIAEIAQKYGSLAYEAVSVSKIPESGYFAIDPLFPLASTINYMAYV